MSIDDHRFRIENIKVEYVRHITTKVYIEEYNTHVYVVEQFKDKKEGINELSYTCELYDWGWDVVLWLSDKSRNDIIRLVQNHHKQLETNHD